MQGKQLTMQVSALVTLTPISRRPSASRCASVCTAGRSGKLFVRAYAAAAVMNPVWRIPPPKSLRNQRAFAMYAFVPTRHEPIGAPTYPYSSVCDAASEGGLEK